MVIVLWWGKMRAVMEGLLVFIAYYSCLRHQRYGIYDFMVGFMADNTPRE